MVMEVVEGIIFSCYAAEELNYNDSVTTIQLAHFTPLGGRAIDDVCCNPSYSCLAGKRKGINCTEERFMHGFFMMYLNLLVNLILRM